jgi:hypothetical protein
LAKPKKRKTAKKHQSLPPIKADTAQTVARLRRYASDIDLSGGRVKPRLLSILFCDFASRTDDLKVNLLGIFDRIFVNPEIEKSPPFVFYARTAETFEDQIWLRVFDPDDEPAIEIRFDPPEEIVPDSGLPAPPKQVQIVIPLQMNFKKKGTYWFDLSYRDLSLGGAGLVVDFED